MTNVATIQIGDTVSYKGGFKVQAGAQATASITASTALTTDLMFTIMDSAVALTATFVTVLAVQTLNF